MAVLILKIANKDSLQIEKPIFAAQDQHEFVFWVFPAFYKPQDEPTDG